MTAMTYPQYPPPNPPGAAPWQPQQPPYAPVTGPPGMPPGYPQAPFYPPPAPKKSRAPLIIGIIAGAVLLVCGVPVAIFVLAGGSSSSTGGTSSGGHAARAGLNQPVRDGKFEFVVKSVTCGKSQEGDSVL